MQTPRRYDVAIALVGGRAPRPLGLGAVSEPSPRAAAHMLAGALQRLGHDVRLLYTGDRAGDHAPGAPRPLRAGAPSCNVLVVVPEVAGAGIDEPAPDARWRILWVHRMELAEGIDARSFDFVYVPWIHLRRPLMSRWNLASDRVLTTSLGIADTPGATPGVPHERDPYRVALLMTESDSPALPHAVLNALHEHDDRFSTEVLDALGPPSGVGRAPAPAAARTRATYLVATRAAAEECPAALLEARGAGLIVVAPSTASTAELILPEYDGALLDTDGEPSTLAHDAAKEIVRLRSDAAFHARHRRGADTRPCTWDAIARRWVAHWDRLNAPNAGAAAPRVSVVMSSWNAAPFVAEAVDSILGQTEWDLELIVVNDGSEDATAEILARYDDARLIVIHQENRGVWAALNRGLQHARGEYIARMDADDISHPTRLRHQLKFLDEHPRIGMVGTSCHKVDATGRIFTLYPVPPDDRAIKQALTHRNPFIHPSIVTRRAVLDRVGVYRKHEAEDYDLWLRVSERFEVANLEAPLFKVRRTGQSRVAVHERAIIESVMDSARRALARCVSGRDADVGPPGGGRPVLGLPVGNLRWGERRAYSETLSAWGDAVLATNRRAALSLYLRAALVAPEMLRHWRASAGCALGIRGRRRAGSPR